MAGTARAASSVLTVTRTSSLPAACSARTCAAVAATSAVSVLVIDWTTIGWALPTSTPPTLTGTVGRRRLTARNLALKDLVLENDPHRHRARQTGAGILFQPRVHTHPQGVGVEDAVGERHGGRRNERNGRRLCTRNGPGRRKVGRPAVRSRGVFREEDLERDRPRPGRVIYHRSRGDRNAIDARVPQPGWEADLLRGDERVGRDRNGRRGESVGNRVPAGRLHEAQHIHIEDRPTLTAGYDERQESGGSKSFHGSPLIDRNRRGHSDGPLSRQ